MFVVLRPVELCGGIIRKRKQRILTERIGASVYRTEKGLPFFLLNVPFDRHGASGKFIFESCGKYSTRLVAPENFVIPEGFGLKRFIPQKINSLLTFNTALALLEKAALPTSSFALTLTDRNGVHVEDACKLLKYSSKIRIITAEPRRFASCVQNAMSEWGASLIVKESYTPQVGNEIVICADGGVKMSMQNSAVISFRNSFCGSLRINCKGVELCDEHKKLFPENTDTVDFAGAITELCRSDEYIDSVYSEFSVNGSEATFEKTAEELHKKIRAENS